MTGVLNRRAFRADVEHELRKKQPGIFLFIDVDNFKSYNDTYGHSNGDLCLKYFAPETVYACMESFQKKISHFTLSTGEVVELSASAGGVIFPEQGEDFVSLCKNADAVLYDIKQNGKATFKMK